jgi:hypothetical protein
MTCKMFADLSRSLARLEEPSFFAVQCSQVDGPQGSSHVDFEAQIQKTVLRSKATFLVRTRVHIVLAAKKWPSKRHLLSQHQQLAQQESSSR